MRRILGGFLVVLVLICVGALAAKMFLLDGNQTAPQAQRETPTAAPVPAAPPTTGTQLVNLSLAAPQVALVIDSIDYSDLDTNATKLVAKLRVPAPKQGTKSWLTKKAVVYVSYVDASNAAAPKTVKLAAKAKVNEQGIATATVQVPTAFVNAASFVVQPPVGAPIGVATSVKTS